MSDTYFRLISPLLSAQCFAVIRASKYIFYCTLPIIQMWLLWHLENSDCMSSQSPLCLQSQSPPHLQFLLLLCFPADSTAPSAFNAFTPPHLQPQSLQHSLSCAILSSLHAQSESLLSHFCTPALSCPTPHASLMLQLPVIQHQPYFMSASTFWLT